VRYSTRGSQGAGRSGRAHGRTASDERKRPPQLRRPLLQFCREQRAVGLIRVPMVRAYAGVAGDDLGNRFNGLNDCVQETLAACHRLKFINRQFTGCAIEHFEIHVSLLFCLGRDHPLMRVGRSDMRTRSVPFSRRVMCLTLKKWDVNDGSKRFPETPARLVYPRRPGPCRNGFPWCPIGGIMGHAHPPAENNLRRNAGC
jgi:hypothetical protein